MKGLSRLIRFFEIDCQYFFTNLPFLVKIYNIFVTDFVIFKNIFLRTNQYSLSLRSGKIVFDTIFATKTFLAAVYDFYIETKSLFILPSEPIIVDVGANIGQYLFAIKSFFPNARVYSFEPDPHIVRILKKNAHKYKKVSIYEMALGSRKGSFSFYRSKHFSEWSSLIKPKDGKFEKITVPVLRGDAIKAFTSLSYIDLIKIDVEGAELDVVKGMLSTIKKSKYLLIETSLARDVSRSSTNELFTVLFSAGFTLDHIGRIFSEGVGKTQGAVDLLFYNRRFYEEIKS